MNNRLLRWSLVIAGFAGLLAVTCVTALCVGSVGVPLSKIWAIIAHGHGTIERDIILNLRLPRVLLGTAVGGALGISGVLLQGLFRNPLVEPYTLGISGGAGLGVCLCIVFKLTGIFGIISYPVSGFLGAAAIVFLVYMLSMRKGMLGIQEILLTGVMLSFIASALIMLVMAVSRVEDLHGIIFWIMGSLDEPNWALIKVAVVTSLVGLLISYMFCIVLNAFALGEKEAFHLGINIERSKKQIFILASVLTGMSVSAAGIIGFIGLVVPHVIRMFVGRDHRILLICSYLCGAAFLIMCDMIARTIIAPMELPVGVVTGMIGGIVFVYALGKKTIIEE